MDNGAATLLQRVEELLEFLDEHPDLPKLRRLTDDMEALAARLRDAIEQSD